MAAASAGSGAGRFVPKQKSLIVLLLFADTHLMYGHAEEKFLTIPRTQDAGIFRARRTSTPGNMPASERLAFDEVEEPARRNRSTNEDRKTECREAHHELRVRALRDAENNRRKEREEQRRTEMSEHYSTPLPSNEALRPVASE
jgi:hypothetical protein